MPKILQRIESLVTGIDEKIERERKAHDLKNLIFDFSRLNKEMTRIVWANLFVMGLTGTPKLKSLFENAKRNYENLEKKLVDLWGENPGKIDVLEPSEFFESINALFKAFNELEAEILSVYNSKKNDAHKKCALAKNFSIIPDMDINLEVFEKARNFLENAGPTVWNISDFVDRNKEKLREKIQMWTSITKKIAVEEKKFDFQNIQGKKLSTETQNILAEFVKNSGEAKFKDFSGVVVDELNANFPELSKILRVSIS